MLTIRLSRVGRKKQAFFHLVVAEKARSAKKKFFEKVGHYNPHTNGGEGEFVFNAERLSHFISNGAQVSQTAARMLTKAGFKEAGKFVAQRVTKPKKEAPKPEVKEEAVVEEAPAAEEVAAEETTEVPAEEAGEEKSE